MAPAGSFFPYSHDEGGPADKAGGSTPHPDDPVSSIGYDPNPSHPTAMGKDDSMAFPSSPASKEAGDGLVYSPTREMEPRSSSSPATADGFVVPVRTTMDVDYSVPDGKAEIYSPSRGLKGQTAE